MDCEVVRLALGQADRRTPRDPRVRAHLRSREDCRAFRRSIRTRRSALAAVVSPLAPWAAGDIPGRLLERGSGPGSGAAAAGGTAVGGLAKLAGASAAAKLGAGAAAVGTAVVAGAAGPGLLGGADPGEGPERPGFLRADAPEARRPPTPAPAPEPPDRRRTQAGRRGPAAKGTPGTAPEVRRSVLVKRGPVSLLYPAASDGAKRGGAALEETKVELSTVRIPDPPVPKTIRVELPDVSGESRVAVDGRNISVGPDTLDAAEIPVRPDIPDIDPPDVPAIEVPEIRGLNRRVRTP